MKHNKNKKGFTIVELVIVIGVIGILAGILIPTFVNVTQKANDAALKSNLANAFSSYVADAADSEIDDVKAVTGHDAAADTTYHIELIKQSEAVLALDGKNYTYSAEKGWEAAADTIAKTPLVVTIMPGNTTDTAVATAPTYNNVQFYKLNA